MPKELHYAYDLEYSHIVREIKTPVTIYTSPDSAKGKCIVGGINDTSKLSDVVIVTLSLPNGIILNGRRFSINNIPGVDILIGMDIITMGDFVITNADGKTLFSFVIPTLNNKISFSKMIKK